MSPTRALLIIDVQEEYFKGPLAIQYPAGETSEAQINRSIAAAQQAGLPLALIQHELPEGAPVFARGSESQKNRPSISEAQDDSWLVSTKAFSSALADDALVQGLKDRGVDTLTLVGYMTNNCVLATAAHAENLGFKVEVLSDATGAIHMKNSAGEASARQVHETLMVLLNSNWAAVASTAEWLEALAAGQALQASDLGSTAVAGSQVFSAQ